ncbi:TauD/TfdA dioxygenase family protein [Allomesorhizobium camelthorni]|uniref:TauD/TfdA family dioxygenase n=1 Tax=Allomesorhizobium camelthorni TaxID=475069 RepID=A0A6G4WNE0_9HYPH|nr:TauD/TfdA family dioxygenase [Mesorhizobium camelthorni]NGO56099.1 TauD/TfdA family dioxygenase [Mesorhizobium camelthorni]
MSETALNVIPRTAVVKRAARIGAEIRNIKLSGDLPDQTIAAIKGLLLEHKVIFFRDQVHLDDAEHERFAIRFGKPMLSPTLDPAKGTMSILEIDHPRGGFRTDTWHIDFAYLDAYPKILVLRGAVIPPVGGDTVWSNTAAAYLDLPAPLQRLADDLWAVHSNAYDFAVFARPTEAEKKIYDEALSRASFETEHPVVRVHPETGERTLVLGLYVKGFVDLPKYDGQKLFDLFESHITAPENTVRWNWKQGDVAIWDNRATMHYAVRDYGDQPRVVRRVAIDGEVPVGVDGRRSVVRTKIIKPPPAASSTS